MNEKHKATIETLINTTAIAMTATGTGWIVGGFTHNGLGVLVVLFGVSLEFFKYWGRKHKYW